MKEATIKININTQNAINSIDELNTEFNGTLSTIGDLRIASQKLSEALERTPVGTAKFQELQQSLIDVNGQLKNYELSIEALDNEQLASEIRSVVGGVMDLVGGLTLLGVSDDNLEKIAQKFAKIEGISRAATGAMDIYNSGAKVMNSILTKSAAAQGVLASATATSTAAAATNTTVTTAMGTASSGAAVKFRALTAAMLANPFTAILIALSAVIGAMALFGDSESDAKAEVDKLNSSLLLQQDILEYNTTVAKQNADAKVALLEAEGVVGQELLDAKIAAIEAEKLAEAQKWKLSNESILKNKEIRTNAIFEGDKEGQDAAQAEIDRLTKLTSVIELDFEARGGYANKYELDKALLRKKNGVEEKAELDKRTEEHKKFYENLNSYIENSNKRILSLNNSLLGDTQNTTQKVITGIKDTTDASVEAAITAYKKISDEIRNQFAGNILSEEAAATIKQINEQRNKEIEKTYEISTKRLINLQDSITKNKEENLNNEFILNQEETLKMSEWMIKHSELTEKHILDEKLLNLKDDNLNAVEYNNKKLIAEQEYNQNILKYQKLLKEDRINAINGIYAAEVKQINKTNELNQKQFENQKELNVLLINENELKIQEIDRQIESSVGKLTTINKAELELKKKLLNEEVIATQKSTEEIEANAKTSADNISKFINESARKNADSINQVEDEIIESQTNIATTTLAINQNVMDQMTTSFDQFGNWVNAISGPLTQVTNILDTIFSDMNEGIQKNIDDTYNAGTEMYNKMFGEQLISREEYDDKIAILDQQKRNDERKLAQKAFNQQKAMNIANATMQGAQAVLASYAAGAGLSPLGPVTTGPLFAGIAGVLAATQIAIVSAQKFKASRGGKVPGQSSNIDSVDAVLAPGEMVINSSSSEMFAPILSAINQVGGGIPLAPSAGLSQSNNNNIVYIENSGSNTVKAYVVESELTNAQKRVDKLRNNASF